MRSKLYTKFTSANSQLSNKSNRFHTANSAAETDNTYICFFLYTVDFFWIWHFVLLVWKSKFKSLNIECYTNAMFTNNGF